MTLSERVRRAGNAKGASVDAERHVMSLLRARVQAIVSADDLAVIARENPERARNEVRSACRRVFSEPDWTEVSPTRADALCERLIDSIFGFGPVEDLLADPTVTEVMINGPSSIYFERAGRLYASERSFEGDAALRAMVDRILGPLGRRIDESSPMVNARLPQGHRVNVVIPPISLSGPVVTIRKFAERAVRLADMRAAGSLDDSLATFLTWSVRARKSMAVTGGTGSGKTTLLNALSAEIAKSERIVTIEDSAELRFFEHPHVVSLEARPRNAEGLGQVTIRDLVTNALRMRPDRIIVGECRGAEALDMLQAMNTGHDGSLTTLHANSPRESVARLATMVRFGADLPVDVIEANIATAIDLVVHVKRLMNGARMVAEVAELSFNREAGRCSTVPVYLRRDGAACGRWLHVPAWVDRLESICGVSAQEVAAWRRSLACAAA